MTLTLQRPSPELLPGYEAALRRGWSPDNTRPAAAGEQLLKIEADSAAFMRSLDDDLEARGDPVTLADESTVPRLPGYVRWLWDGEFCGSIGFRRQNGTPALLRIDLE